MDDERAYQREYHQQRYASDPLFREKEKAKAREYFSRPEVKARRAAAKKERYATDPEYKAKLQEYQKLYRPEWDKGRRDKSREYHRKRRQDPRVREMLQENTRKYSERYRIQRLASHAIARAKKDGREYDAVYLKEVGKLHPESCPCCGVTLRYDVTRGGSKNPLPNGPSLDRVDTTRGYIRGNVDIICWRCNALKRDATLAELEKIVLYMRSRL